MLACLLAVAFVLPAMAQTNESPSTPLANRYLLVVETSRSMQRRAPASLKALSELLASGFRGQIRPEDTLGIWTFNEDLYTGHFPLQHWSAQNQAAISQRVLDFVSEQKYEKVPDFNKLLPALDQLVKNSPYITIILVTDGEDKIRGTPFDTHINELYDDWRDRQQKAQMPFLTVLRGKRGVILDYTVTPAPWPVEMPVLPKELQLPEVALQKTAPKAPAPTVPPLIVRGKRPDPAPTGTNAAVAQTPAPVAPAAAVVASEKPAATPLTNAPANLSASLTASNPAPAPVAQAEPVPGALAQPPSEAKPASQPLAQVITNHAAPATAGVARPPVPSAPVHNAAALPPTAPAGRKGFWIGVAVLTTALLGLVVVLLRRARPAPTASLITRSLERQGK